MKYQGTFLGKMVDSKRRFSLPRKWIDDNTQFCFVSNPGEKIVEFRLYPMKEWEKEFQLRLNADQKVDFARRSIYTELKKGRLMLPKGCTWEKVDLIGVVDFIIVIESVV